MSLPITAVELTGTVDNRRHLILDGPLPIIGPKRVRVIVLYSSSEEWDEAEWLGAATRNPAFAYLKDSAEDIYSLADGKSIDT